MDNDEMLETTNDTENVDTQATEEFEAGVGAEPTEFTDSEQEEVAVVDEEKELKFTQEDVDRFVKDRLSRQEVKIREEYEQKYGRLETVMNAGLGTKDIEEVTQKMTDFYKGQGVEIPEMRLTARQERILADAEAKDVIDGGYDEIVETVDRLANKGLDKMTSKEKLIFTKLAEERKRQEGIRELAKIGVGKEVLEDKDFIDFSNKLNPSLTAKEKYEMYEKMKPKKKVETMGSMKSGSSKDTGVKEFYSREEAQKFTREDFDKNPELFKAVEKSMLRW